MATSYTPDKQILNDQLVAVCKYRQGAQCCKYVVFVKDKLEFFCVKKIPDIKHFIDQQQMSAKGDNCPGLPDEKT